MLCLKNAQFIHDVTIDDRAFHYGDGCFTTARIRHGNIELEELHRTRLHSGMECLGLTVSLQFIDQSLQQLKIQHGDLNGTLKIIISRGAGQRGYSFPTHDADLWVFYYPKMLEDFCYDEIQSGVLRQTMGLTMPHLVGLKSLNRLEQVVLKHEADTHGWSEALALDIQGDIVEGVSSNCFIRMNNRWITPELRYNGVHGVMRAEILSRMRHHNIVCERRRIAMDDISKIQSLFFCNALNPMKIVSDLDGHRLDTQVCIELFHTLQLKQIH